MDLPSLIPDNDLNALWETSVRHAGSDTTHIGIIGAGPAGLAALKAVIDSPQYKEGTWKVVVFEARGDVGGVWLPEPPSDAESVHAKSNVNLPPTPLYDSLTTNLPHPIMAYSAFPFPASTPLFPPAKTVEAYLRSYADKFELRRHILFNTRVVRTVWDGVWGKWVVDVDIQPSEWSGSASNEQRSSKFEFDLVMVCNGHHNIPRYPSTPSLDTWLSSHRASHSMFYRNPGHAPFALDGKHTVLVVGGGPSGADIVDDVRGVVRRVVHSASAFSAAAAAAAASPGFGVEQEGNVTHRGRLVRFLSPPTSDGATKGAVEFEGGVVETDIDYVILATGYEVHFPFIPQTYMKEGIPPGVPPLPKGVWNTSYGVFPLARYLFPFALSASSEASDSSPIPSGTPILHPSPTSLVFLGLLVRVVPLPLLEVQARTALAAFANPERVDWTGEAVGVVQRYEEVKARLGLREEDEAGKEGKEEKIHKAFFRFAPMDQFNYRDALVDLILSLLGIDHVDEANLRVRRAKQWERDLYARKDVLRQTWRELEASGEAEAWVSGVGEGRGAKTVEEEWVELMWRVVRRGEGGGDTEGEEERARL